MNFINYPAKHTIARNQAPQLGKRIKKIGDWREGKGWHHPFPSPVCYPAHLARQLLCLVPPIFAIFFPQQRLVPGYTLQNCSQYTTVSDNSNANKFNGPSNNNYCHKLYSKEVLSLLLSHFVYFLLEMHCGKNLKKLNYSGIMLLWVGIKEKFTCMYVALVAKLQLFCCFFVVALPTRRKVHFSVSCHVMHQCSSSSETRYTMGKKS